MSVAGRPSGSPDSPPIPNIGRNAGAKSIGVVNRIDPPYNDSSNEVTRSPTESR
jgi:hypothetical protein